MPAIVICAIVLVLSYWAGRRGLAQGLVAVMIVGYFYGIVRANILHPASHFIFDASLIGFYLSQHNWFSSSSEESARLGGLRVWLAILIGWPFLVALLPFQPWLVTLVGLRGNTFFLPMIMVGAWLKNKDLSILSSGIAVLNLVALGFAGAEYFTSVTRFYPPSAVTSIIYASTDAGEGFHRIPAIFSSAHAYGGSMVATLPFLIGLWTQARSRTVKMLAISSIMGSMLGVLLSSTRLNFVLGSAMVLSLIFAGQMGMKYRVAFVIIVVALGVTAVSNVRFQRFKSLGDTERVTDRVAGSVNRKFIEILVEHPMGNGLGGGGTSLPYFLQSMVRKPIGMENEYARILCEQGVIGLLLWLSFISWFISRAKVAFLPTQWLSSRRLAWCYCAVSVATCFIGTGILTSIPQTALFLLSLGWCASMPIIASRRADSFLTNSEYQPAYVVRQ